MGIAHTEPVEVPEFQLGSTDRLYRRILREDYSPIELSDFLASPTPWACLPNIGRVINYHEEAAVRIREWIHKHPNNSHAHIVMNEEAAKNQLPKSLDNLNALAYHTLKFRFTPAGDQSLRLITMVLLERGQLIPAALFAKGHLRDKASAIARCDAAPIKYAQLAMKIFEKTQFEKEAKDVEESLKLCKKEVVADQTFLKGYTSPHTFLDIWKEELHPFAEQKSQIPNYLRMALAYGATGEETMALFEKTGFSACHHLNYSSQTFLFRVTEGDEFYNADQIFKFWVRYPKSFENAVLSSHPDDIEKRKNVYKDIMDMVPDRAFPITIPLLLKRPELFPLQKIMEDMASFPQYALPFIDGVIEILARHLDSEFTSVHAVQLLAKIYEIAPLEKKKFIEDYFIRTLQALDETRLQLARAIALSNQSDELTLNLFPELLVFIETPMENLPPAKLKEASQTQQILLEKLAHVISTKAPSLRRLLLPIVMRRHLGSQRLVRALGHFQEDGALIIDDLINEIEKMRPHLNARAFDFYSALLQLEAFASPQQKTKIKDIITRLIRDDSFLGFFTSDHYRDVSISIFQGYQASSDPLAQLILAELNVTQSPHRIHFLLNSLGFLEKNSSPKTSHQIQKALIDAYRNLGTYAVHFIVPAAIGRVQRLSPESLAEILHFLDQDLKNSPERGIIIDSLPRIAENINADALRPIVRRLLNGDIFFIYQSAIEQSLLSMKAKGASREVIDELFKVAANEITIPPSKVRTSFSSGPTPSAIRTLSQMSPFLRGTDYEKLVSLLKAKKTDLLQPTHYPLIEVIESMAFLPKETDWTTPWLINLVVGNDISDDVRLTAIETLTTLAKEGGWKINLHQKQRLMDTIESVWFPVRHQIRDLLND